ncbi:MAG: sensor histidine kinase [Planctomycetota bacterium]
MRFVVVGVVLVLSLGIAFAALGWITGTALELECRERDAQRTAESEEAIRLALWRMDSALAPLLTRETDVSSGEYETYYSLDALFSPDFQPVAPQSVLVPSRLLTLETPEVLVHFQIGADTALSSPEAIAGDACALAIANNLTSGERVARATERLQSLAPRLDFSQLLSALPEPAQPTPPPQVRESQLPAWTSSTPRAGYLDQLSRNRAEYQTRVIACSTDNNGVFTNSAPPYSNAIAGIMRPLWVGDALLLARRVRTATGEVIQGCQLDWPRIRTNLLASCADLLPHADLIAASEVSSALRPEGRQLAALPVSLIPGALPAGGELSANSTVRFTLALAWSSAIAAACAIVLLLTMAFILGERRRRFVSAVTHELRTPLTTFRLYTEMLRDGMVRDEAKRAEYTDRLYGEAERLDHLVENVLAYSHLEGTRTARSIEHLSPTELFSRLSGQLAARANAAGLELRCTSAPEAQQNRRLQIDSAAVERILFNLIDNASKYARPSAQPEIELDLTAHARSIELRVRDYGPGIPTGVARRLFRAFSRPAHSADRGAHGIGLGLSLSRRLARSMGGDLRYEPAVGGGAMFVLTLPLG